jgi:hypothetical protein
VHRAKQLSFYCLFPQVHVATSHQNRFHIDTGILAAPGWPPRGPFRGDPAIRAFIASGCRLFKMPPVQDVAGSLTANTPQR